MNRNRSRTRATLLVAMTGAALAHPHAHALEAAPAAGPSETTYSADQARTDDVSKLPQSTKVATATNADTEEATKMSEVVVTTLRDSLQNAQTIKRNATMVVDSIVAEDIGKLPDNSVADALQRVTGVQVAQGGQGQTAALGQGETATVLVRGLPNVLTTLNGNEIFNAFGRQYSFQDLPATAVRTLSVFKSTDAPMVAGGMAGTIDIRTFRPFDFDGFKMAGTFSDSHQHYGGKWDPTGSVMLSDRWVTDVGDVGALANFSETTMTYNYASTYNDWTRDTLMTDGAGQPIRVNGDLVSSPTQMGGMFNRGYRKRPEANWALQWGPGGGSEVYAEGIYTWFSDQFTQPFYFTNPAQGLSAPTQLTVSNSCYPIKAGFTPNDSQYVGQTVCDPSSATWTNNSYAATSTQAHQEWGHTFQNTLGAKWRGDQLSLSSSLTATRSVYEIDTVILDTFIKSPITTAWGPGNQWNLVGGPQLDPASYYFAGYYPQWHNNLAKQIAWRGDGNFHIGNVLLRSLDFGIRYSDKDADSQGVYGNHQLPPPGSFPTNNPNPAYNVLNTFGSSFFCPFAGTPTIPAGTLSGCPSFLIGNQNAIRALYGVPGSRDPADPGQFFEIKEKDLAGYLQVSYGNELLGMPFDGVIGTRLERVDRTLSAFTFSAATNAYLPNGSSGTRSYALPNGSFNLHLRDDLQLRLVAGKTLTYPNFSDLDPAMSLYPGTPNSPAQGSGGNPNLAPIKATSYDGSLEWYFAKVGSLTAGFFRHDVTGYIQSFQKPETINGVSYLITRPESSGSGYIEGVEIAYQQFFDFLPGALSGLGVQGNYTYLDSSAPVQGGGPNGNQIVSLPLQGVSRDNYNVVLIYEKYGISARLAYGFRNPYPNFFNTTNLTGYLSENYVHQANMLDLSVAYDIDHHVTAVFNATNLLHNNLMNYDGPGIGSSNGRLDTISYQDYSIGFGVRVKF